MHHPLILLLLPADPVVGPRRVLIGLAGHAAVGGLTGQDAFRIGLTGSAIGLAVGYVPLMLAFLAGGIGGGKSPGSARSRVLAAREPEWFSDG